MQTNTETDIDKLNSFLRGERSAVETYDKCIEKMDDPTLRQQLEYFRRSHMDRVQKLEAQVVALGGTPDRSSGTWGTFAKLVQGGASVLGTKAAIAALEEGEDHGLNDYDRDINDLSPPTRQFVQNEIVPEQRKTHDGLSALKKAS